MTSPALAPTIPSEWSPSQVNGPVRVEFKTPEAEIVERLTTADQALWLHDEIFTGQNGIPSVDAYTGARQFLDTLHYDENAEFINGMGERMRGAYYGTDGERIPSDIVLDLREVANPARWVQGDSHQDVLAHARDILYDEDSADLGANAPTLALAEAIIGRVADPERVDADNIQALLNLDAVAREDLWQRKGGEELVDRIALRNERMVEWLPYEPARGRANTGTTSAFPHSGQAQERLVNWKDRAGILQPTGRAQVRGPQGGPDSLYAVPPRARSHTETLADLIENGTMQTAEDIALALYPQKLLGGTGTYGAVIVGTTRRLSEERHRLDRLTAEERARVEGFAAQLAAMRHQERIVHSEFRAGHALPTHQELFAILFPEVTSRTPEHWAVVRLGMDRLRDLRLQEVRPDRFVVLRLRLQAIKEAAPGVLQNLKEKSLSVAGGFKSAYETAGDIKEKIAVQAKDLHERAPTLVEEAKTSVKGLWERVKALKERLHPEKIKEALKTKVAAGVGATAMAAATMAEEKPWKRIMPTIRERLIPAVRERWIPRMAAAGKAVLEFARNVEFSRPALALGVKLQMLKLQASEKLQSYIQGRINTVRQTERGEWAYRATFVAAGLVFFGAVAVREYLQHRHNVHVARGGMSHDTLPLPDGSDHSSVDTLQPAAPHNGHNLPTSGEIGTYDGHVKIMGYPKGTVGYRILEHAQQAGLDVHDKAQADRLIGETLKMDHLGWSVKVSADQKIGLLSYDQMMSTLGRQ